MSITMSDDILDKYAADAPATQNAAGSFTPDNSVFSKYDRTDPVETPSGRLYVSPENPTPRSRADVVDASGFNNRMASSIPIVGPLFDKATAATGAAIQPLLSKDAASKTFSQRYQENLAFQDAQNRLYEEQHPVGALAADVTGGAVGLGPLSETAVGSRMLGMTGASLGSRVYQGAAGMGAIEAADQGIKGNNPLNQGVLGPVPLAAAGGALGPMIGHGIGTAGNALASWLPRQTGELAGVNSVGRNMLVSAMEGETPASIAEAKTRYGPSGMLSDVNNATTDIAGGLADIPGPQKEMIREAYRQRAAGQADRIEQSLNKNTVPHTNVANLTRALQEARATDADPLYNQFRTMQIHPTDEIKALMPRLEASGAFNKAEELSGISGRPINRNFFTGGPQKAFPTAENWDYVKRGLDRRIGDALDKTKPDKDLARELLNLKSEMLAAIDKTPAGQVYKKAREVYAEPSELLHQIQEGKKTFSRTTDKEELAHELNSLSGPELSARVQGARKAVQDVLESSVRGDTTARNMLLARSNRDKLEMLFGQKRADRLIQDLEAEVAGKAQKENIVGGSQTTPKKERVNALTPQPGDMGYFSNLNLTKPTSFIPEWMHPHTIMEGARAQRYADAYRQIAPLLTTKMGSPQFNPLVNALHSELASGEALRSQLGRAGTQVARGTAIAAPAIRNSLVAPPAERKRNALSR
jgi:hypothetical protein